MVEKIYNTKFIVANMTKIVANDNQLHASWLVAKDRISNSDIYNEIQNELGHIDVIIKCDKKVNTFNENGQHCNQIRHGIKKEITWALLIKNDTSVVKWNM